MDSSLMHPPFYIENQISEPFLKDKMEKEIVWTYLVARKFENNPGKLAKLLGVKETTMPEEPKIWLEAYLQPTRENEGNYWKTRSDLSMGYLEVIEGTDLQIRSKGNWVCICEAKWKADIHYDKKNKVNQLAKLIEHALLLRNQDGVHPERVYVTLITPKYFRDKPKEKNYQNISKYQEDKNLIVNDLQMCDLQFKNNVNYSFLKERLSRLILNWVIFEELLGLSTLVEDHKPGKNRVTIDSWEKVLTEIRRKDLYNELSSKTGGK